MSKETELVNNLEELNQKHETLLSLLERKLEAILEREIEKLAKINEEGSELVGEIRGLHEERRNLWVEIAGEEVTTVEDLLPVVGSELGNRLQSLAEQLRRNNRDIQIKTERISEALRNRMRDIDNVFETVFEVLNGGEEEQTYDESGQKSDQENKQSMVFDEAV